MHTQSTIPAPTNLYELATFPEPIFSDRFSFTETVHPATFVGLCVGYSILPHGQWESLLITAQEVCNSDLDYYLTWREDETIFRMFLLFVWEANQPAI